MTKDLLPIGSVVKLHGAEKKLMITGISVQQENDSKVYDYIAVPFPEGYLSNELMFLFQHDDIETIEFIGLLNSEVQIFRSKLMESESADESK